MRGRRPHRTTTRLLAAITLGSWLSAIAGCSPYQTWTTFTYRKLGREIKTVTLPEKTYTYKLVSAQGGYYLHLRQRTHCKRVVQDRVRETVHHRVKAPAATYYIVLGSVIAVVAVPFYVIGAKATGEKRRNNILMGTLMFVVPGGTLAGIGGYLKAQEGTTHKDLGVTRRTVRSKKYVCKTKSVQGKSVSLGTLIGKIKLGKTDRNGRIRLSPGIHKPLVRYKFAKPTKVYLDVYVDDENIGELEVPWGHPKPRGPTFKPKPGPRRGAAKPRRSPARPLPTPGPTVKSRPRPRGDTQRHRTNSRRPSPR